MNEEFGVDFIARCMAGEALEKAGTSAWTLVAGNNISILSDEEEKTETISAEIEVDSALSTTSENPVQNKVITNTLKTKPTSVDTSGNPINDQKIMALTRAQYNAIQNKDPNTYYMITDDPVPQTTPILRTGYTSVLNDYTSSYDSDGNWILTFEPKVNFEKLDVYLQWHFDWSAGTDWPVSTATRSIMLSLTKDVPGPVVSTGMNVYLANSVTQPNNPNSNLLYDVLMGSINVNYNAQTNTVTMLVAKPMMVAISDPNQDKNNIPVAMTNCVANAFGYVAYGSDNYIIYDGLQAGTGINLNDDVVSIDPDYVPSDVSANITTSAGASYLTVQLEDGNGLPMGNGSTVLLPSGGGGGSFTQVQSDWNQTNSNSVDFIRNKPDLSDMATRTWVGQQGYLTSADEVPTVGSSDNNKILKATYSGGVGSYSWQPNIQAGNGLTQVGNWFEVETPVPEVLDKERCVLVTIPENDPDYGDPTANTAWLKLRAGHVEYDETAGEDVIVNDATPGSVLTWTGEEIQWETPTAGGGTTKRFFPNFVRKNLQSMPQTYEQGFYDYAMLFEGELKEAVQNGADYIAVHLTVAGADKMNDGLKIYSNLGDESNPNWQPMQFYDGSSQSDDLSQNGGKVTFGYEAPSETQTGWVFFKSWDVNMTQAMDLSTSKDLMFYAPAYSSASIWIDEVKVVSFQNEYDPTDNA